MACMSPLIRRGNEHRDIFFDDDGERFHALLREGVNRFGYRVHSEFGPHR